MIEITECLRRLRGVGEPDEVSQRQMAMRFGMHQPHLSRIEGGVRNVLGRHVVVYVTVLGERLRAARGEPDRWRAIVKQALEDCGRTPRDVGITGPLDAMPSEVIEARLETVVVGALTMRLG